MALLVSPAEDGGLTYAGSSRSGQRRVDEGGNASEVYMVGAASHSARELREDELGTMTYLAGGPMPRRTVVEADQRTALMGDMCLQEYSLSALCQSRGQVQSSSN